MSLYGLAAKPRFDMQFAKELISINAWRAEIPSTGFPVNSISNISQQNRRENLHAN